MLVAIVGADSLTNLEFGLLFVFGLFIAGLLPLAVSLEFRAAVSEKPSLFVKKDLKFIIDSSGKALDAQKFYQFWETSSPST